MKTPARTGPSRLIVYALILAAAAVVVTVRFRLGPALMTASVLPLVAVGIVCAVMMFFMMRGMSDQPR